jgi:hypothetical protein
MATKDISDIQVLLDYGTSLRGAWLTDKGKAMVEHFELERELEGVFSSAFKCYVKLLDLDRGNA